ncbi:MAG: cell division protein FtsZ [Bryobacteraceae bacterium]|jgi:cell division protein FtsZ
MPVLDSLKYEMQEDVRAAANIKIIGVGGGGANAVAHMMTGGLESVEFYVLNTDMQALQASPVPNKLAIGSKITQGRGAGGDPGIGRQAALEDTARICEILQGADMVFIAAGLGCGTGTGAAPVVASMAKELNALTVAVVTKPFGFEGTRRMRQAEKGLEELAAFVDTVIAIPNDRLLALAPRGTGVFEAFRMGHEFLRQTVADLVEIMTLPGFINRDFSDVRSTMFGMGCALLGTATARGENAAVEAAREAIGCPLHEDAGIRGARNVLLNVTGSSRLGLHEVNEACQLIRDATRCEDVEVNFGIVLNEAMEDAVKVTVIATGFSGAREALAVEPGPAIAQTVWLTEAQAPAAAPVEPPAPPAEPQAGTWPGNGSPPLPEPEDLDDIDKPAYLRQRRSLH